MSCHESAHSCPHESWKTASRMKEILLRLDASSMEAARARSTTENIDQTFGLSIVEQHG